MSCHQSAYTIHPKHANGADAVSLRSSHTQNGTGLWHLVCAIYIRLKQVTVSTHTGCTWCINRASRTRTYGCYAGVSIVLLFCCWTQINKKELIRWNIKGAKKVVQRVSERGLGVVVIRISIEMLYLTEM